MHKNISHFIRSRHAPYQYLFNTANTMHYSDCDLAIPNSVAKFSLTLGMFLLVDQPPRNQYFHRSLFILSWFYFCASWTIQNCHFHWKQCYMQETEILSCPWPLLPLMCWMIYMGKLPWISFSRIQNLFVSINESTATAASPSHHLTPL